MKIAGSEFEVEEMLFLPALVLFFGMIFIGAWNFSADYPLFLGTAALSDHDFSSGPGLSGCLCPARASAASHAGGDYPQ